MEHQNFFIVTFLDKRKQGLFLQKRTALENKNSLVVISNIA